MTTWHDRADFWEKMAPFLFTDRHWASVQEEVDGLIKLLEIEEGEAVLDLCCGPGRHSLEFARRGLQVTGVDITSAYLDEALRNAEEEDLTIEFIQEDMRRFRRSELFHGAILMYTSFGYFENQEENFQVLANIRESLKDDGKLIIDVMGKEVLARIFQEKGWEEQDGIFFLQEREISRDWSWIENRWILLEGHDRFEIEVAHWLYSAAELSGMLRETGFSSVKCYGDLMGAAYGPEARRLVCLAEK